MPEPLLGAGDIERLLGEVAAELPSDRQRQIILVGGARLALAGLRSATRDVDSVARLDSEMRQAIGRVAVRNELAPAWMNDAAEPFLPAAFDIRDCTTVVDRPSLLVLAAPLDQVFLMKVFASRAADAPDLDAMWPRFVRVRRSGCHRVLLGISARRGRPLPG